MQRSIRTRCLAAQPPSGLRRFGKTKPRTRNRNPGPPSPPRRGGAARIPAIRPERKGCFQTKNRSLPVQRVGAARRFAGSPSDTAFRPQPHRNPASTVAVHLLIVFFVLAGGDVVHPLLVVEIPAYRLLDSLLELQRGFPAQLVFQFARIDGIPQVVPRTVGDVGDELLALASDAPSERPSSRSTVRITTRIRSMLRHSLNPPIL